MLCLLIVERCYYFFYKNKKCFVLLSGKMEKVLEIKIKRSLIDCASFSSNHTPVTAFKL